MCFYTLLLFVCMLLGGNEVPAHERAWKPDCLLITFWSAPPATEEALTAVATEGYNLTWTPEAGLEVARKHGLKAMLQDDLLTPATLDNSEKRAKLDALIDRVKGNPALEAYFLTDEPGASAFPGLGRLVDYLRQHDPAHLAYINLFPTYANNEQLGTKGDTVTAYRAYLQQYLQIVKPALLSYDHYHFFKTYDGNEYFLNLGMVRQAALEAHIPFLNIVQACTIEKVWRLVNADELRWLVYTTLAYGGRGISYFLYSGPASYGGLYQDGRKTPLADDVAGLNKEIAALSPVLMGMETLGAYHTDPLPLGGEAVPATCPVQFAGSGEFVLGLFGKGGKAHAFMVVNRSYQQETSAHLRVSTRRIEEYNRTTQRWERYPVTEHTLSVPLTPGEGRLFRF